MTENNNDIRYSISPADTPKDTRGTPASDLLLDPAAQIPTATRNYATPKTAAAAPNLSNAHVPPSVLRDMLRDAEAEHQYKHKQRKKKLFLTLFWIFFAVYAVGMAFIMLAGYGSLSIGDSIILVGTTTVMCIPSAAITAFFYRFIIITGYTRAFAGDAEELQYIEHLKDCMCSTSERGQA